MAAPRTLPGQTRGTVNRAVANQRMTDGRSLLVAGRYNGAIYLAGYAVECHLQYAYCERKEEAYFPARFTTHNWDVLVEAAGLWADFRAAPKLSNLFFELVDQWGPSLRYRTNLYQREEARRLYKDLQEFYRFLQELVP